MKAPLILATLGLAAATILPSLARADARAIATRLHRDDTCSSIVVTGDWSGSTQSGGNIGYAVGYCDGSFAFFPANDARLADFAGWSMVPGVRPIAGHFSPYSSKPNGVPWIDYALTGGYGWGSIPARLGNITTTNNYVDDFGTWAKTPGVTVLSGDFDGDGLTDIALIGGPGWWASVPVAYSLGDGYFYVMNIPAAWMSQVSQQGPTVQALAGDFNGDGKTDIALTGGQWWNTVPVMMSLGRGQFADPTNYYLADFPDRTKPDFIKVVAGDFDKDGLTDLAAMGGNNTADVAIAYSNGDGTFLTTPCPDHTFAYRASELYQFIMGGQGGPTQPLVGDFNGDHIDDIALVGGLGWTTVPIAYGTFHGRCFSNYTEKNASDWMWRVQGAGWPYVSSPPPPPAPPVAPTLPTPTAPPPPPNFKDDIWPIFRGKCVPCHQASSVPGKQFAIGTDVVIAYNATQEIVTPAAVQAGCMSGSKVGPCTFTRIKNGSMPALAGCTGDPTVDATPTGDPTIDAARQGCTTQGDQEKLGTWIMGGMLKGF